MLGCKVQKPLGRNVIDTDKVGVQLADLGKVACGLLGGGEGLAGGVRGKRTVRHSLDVELLFAEPEKLAIDADARLRKSRDCHGL